MLEGESKDKNVPK